jgi:arylformamidase
MNIIDISWPIGGNMTTYKNKKTLNFRPLVTWQEHKARETSYTLTTHTGTHVDAPAHFIEDGSTVESLSLSALCGPALVVDVTHCDDRIALKDILELPLKPGMRVLFKTRNSLKNSDDEFDPLFVYLADDAAYYLAQLPVAAVGIDYLGVERNQPNHETHHTLLSRKIVLIEGLRLAHVEPGVYTLFCLPLLMPGLDGAPARAILIK